MDKNTGIGLVLIVAIVMGFTFLTRPSQEEIERDNRRKDSISNIQKKQVAEDIAIANTDQAVEKEQSPATDFFSANISSKTDSITSNSTDSLGSLDPQITSNQPKEQIISLENEIVKIDFSTKGGQMLSAQLKNYKKYNGDSLYLFKTDANLSLELINKKGIALNTDKAIFTPIQSSFDANQTLVMRMNYSDTEYIDFIYSLAPNSYMMKFDIAVVGMQNLLSVDCLEKFKLNWSQKLYRQEKSEKMNNGTLVYITKVQMVVSKN